MKIAIVTGSSGLIGSAAVAELIESGYRVVGVDNDMRSYFFGANSSTASTTERLIAAYGDQFLPVNVDIRERAAIGDLFVKYSSQIELIVHTAAQPSHDWAAREPHTDFAVNATGTLSLLEAARNHSSDATFAFLSTNKVYGDLANFLPLEEHATRLELPRKHQWFHGINTTMSIDRSTHSLFGVSKAAADLMVQEYGRYFDMPTVCFRGGCLTGPQHAGAELHGFLAYLMRCVALEKPYTVFGYGGKQVRDNIHAIDVVRAIKTFHSAPKAGAVYNIGGGRQNSVSVLEAIELCTEISGNNPQFELSDQARIGDHRWRISDNSAFERDYPQWSVEISLDAMLCDIYESNIESWIASSVPA